MGKGLGCGRTLEVLDRVPMLTVHYYYFIWIKSTTHE
jgi:hypothetical protein